MESDLFMPRASRDLPRARAGSVRETVPAVRSANPYSLQKDGAEVPAEPRGMTGDDWAALSESKEGDHV